MPKTTPARVFVTSQVLKEFAGVRGRVRTAVAASPRSVSFSEALAQVKSFQAVPPKKQQ